jgi:hypothetical protein
MTITELETLAADRFMARADAIRAVLADPANVTRACGYIYHTRAGKTALDAIHRTMPTSEAVCGRVTVRAIQPKNVTMVRRAHLRFQYRVDGKLVARREAEGA